MGGWKGDMPVNDGLNPIIGRRDFFRVLTVGAGAAAASAVPLSGALADAFTDLQKTKPGYLLLFPFYITNIAGMQTAQVAHSVVAVLFVALILGRIYIGTLGMEGAFEAMATGEVDFNWAKEHHDLWLEEQIAKDRVPDRHASAIPAE